MTAAGEPGQSTVSVLDAVVGMKWNHSRKIYDLLLGKECSYSIYAKRLGEHTCPCPHCGKTVLEKNVTFWMRTGGGSLNNSFATG